jgi:endo-1,4-beta-xylanase
MSRIGLDRRAFIASALALAASGCATPAPGPPPSLPEPAVDLEARPPLREVAAARGLFYGASAISTVLDRDPAFAAAFARECGLLVPDYEAKWDQIQPAPGLFDFSKVNRLVEFARAHGMLFRGHALLWHHQVPSWLPPALASEDPRNILEAHVRRVVEQYRGAVHSWDVVNEAVELNDGRSDGLRNSLWLKSVGPGYLDLAFRVAHEADPGARLSYNDYGLDHAEVWNVRKRVAVLELLRDLRGRDVPINALGLQAHLTAGLPFDGAGLRAFIRAVAALGLEVYVTELDVIDARLPDDGTRDAKVARLVGDYLGAVLAEPAVKGVITWGLSDKYSWLNSPSAPEARRGDGKPVRGLPLDPEMRRTAMWKALADSLGTRVIGYNSDGRAAPDRQG